jgi:hypothetical protein
MQDDLSLLEMRLATQPKRANNEVLSDEQTERLSLWSQLNIPFEKNLFNGDEDFPPIIYTRKSKKICLVSVHGISHFSRKSDVGYKIADLNTGGLVRLLQAKLDVSSTIKYNGLKSANSTRGQNDANKAVADFLSSNHTGVVIDIHGCKDNNDFDLAVGTHINPPNEAQRRAISLLFRRSDSYGIRIAENPHCYQARAKSSITARAIAEFPNSPVLQLEIARSLRCPQERNLRSALLVDFMYDAIAQILNTVV